jgi:hypothetical protein
MSDQTLPHWQTPAAAMTAAQVSDTREALGRAVSAETYWKDRAERLTVSLASGDASDGHHTHNELYEYRLLYNAAAANAWAQTGLYPVVKSWRHSDGEECFGGGWFIVVATLPSGQVSNHYQAEHWNLFSQVPEVELPPIYDGHTPAEASARLRSALADES